MSLIRISEVDHSLAAYDLDKMGIKVIAPYVEKPKDARFGGFFISYFPLTDNEDHFVHTNGDGSECPIYGYMIQHDKEPFKMLYITDCSFIKWRFKGVDNLLIGIDYMDEYLEFEENEAKKKHTLSGHLELKTAVEFIKTTDRDKTLKNIVVGHLSDSNSDTPRFEREIEKVTNANLMFAKRGGEYNL